MLVPLVAVLHYGMTSELTVAQDILCLHDYTLHIVQDNGSGSMSNVYEGDTRMQLSVTMIRSCTSAEHKHATCSFYCSTTIL